MAEDAASGCDVDYPAISRPDLTHDFDDFFGRTAMQAREEAILKRLASQSLFLPNSRDCSDCVRVTMWRHRSTVQLQHQTPTILEEGRLEQKAESENYKKKPRNLSFPQWSILREMSVEGRTSLPGSAKKYQPCSRQRETIQADLGRHNL